MKKTKSKKSSKKVTRKTRGTPSRRATPRRTTSRNTRARMERALGRKLLSGEIPVIDVLPRCPVPPAHVKQFADLCKQFERGEISEADVQATVRESLHRLRPEPREPEYSYDYEPAEEPMRVVKKPPEAEYEPEPSSESEPSGEN